MALSAKNHIDDRKRPLEDEIPAVFFTCMVRFIIYGCLLPTSFFHGEY